MPSKNNHLLDLFALAKRYPRSVLMLIILGILASLTDGISISLLIPFLQTFESLSSNNGANNAFVSAIEAVFGAFSQSQRIIVIPLCILIAIALRSTFTYAAHVISSQLNARVGHYLRSNIFHQLLTLHYSYLEQFEEGKLLNILSSESWQVTQALQALVELMIAVSTTFVLVTLLVLLSWPLTILIAIATCLIAFLIKLLTRRVAQLSEMALECNNQLGVRMYEGLLGLRTIRDFRQEQYEQQRFDDTSTRVEKTFFHLDLMNKLVDPIHNTLSAALAVFVLIIALMSNEATLPSLLTFLFILHRLQPRVQEVLSKRVYLLSLSASTHSVLSFIKTSDKPYVLSGHKAFSGLQEGVSFKKVDFAYPHTHVSALEGVNLFIAKGKTTALVGPSGAGKSTLLKLFCRYYEPTSGTIDVDDTALNQLNLDDWRDRIAIVSQDVHIFSDTVRQNIAYGKLHATDEDVVAAAKQANAHEFICQLPRGYDTPVGDRGVRLSGGQRQRIALARAIVRDPEILVLDEATNALDTLSEYVIQQALQIFGRDRTVIIIAHRLSTIEQADQIVVVESGHIVEQGTLSELLTQAGLFKQLYQYSGSSLS